MMGLLVIVCGAGIIFPFTLPICAAGLVASAVQSQGRATAECGTGWSQLRRRVGPVVASEVPSDVAALDAAVRMPDAFPSTCVASPGAFI